MSSSTDLEAALELAKMGYPVFSVVEGGKQPFAGSHGFLDATTDPDTIREMWGGTNENANIGLATEGLVAIDIDPGAEWPGISDHELALDLSSGIVVRTPRGGSHHIFGLPDGHAWKSKTGAISDHVDTRAIDGYLIVSPSVVNGKPYIWVNELPRFSDLPLPSPRIVEILDRKCSVVEASNQTEGKNDHYAAGDIPEGRRNSTLASLAGTMRRPGMSQRAICAALSVENEKRCKPPLPEGEVRNIASSISRYEPNYTQVAVVQQSHAGPPEVAQEEGSNGGEIVYADTTDWRKKAEEPLEYVFSEVLPKGIVASISAPGGVGKSYLALMMAVSLATECTLLDFLAPERRMRVACFFGEDPERIVYRRLLAIEASYKDVLGDSLDVALEEGYLKFHCLQPTPLTDEDHGRLTPSAFLEQLYEEAKKADFVIIDPISKWHGMPSENENAIVSQFMNLLTKLTENGCTVLFTHHVNKGHWSGKVDRQVSPRGATAFIDECRFAAVLDTVGLPDGLIAFEIVKNNYCDQQHRIEHLVRGPNGVLINQPDIESLESPEEVLMRQVAAFMQDLGEKIPKRDFEEYDRKARNTDVVERLMNFLSEKPTKSMRRKAVNMGIRNGVFFVVNDPESNLPNPKKYLWTKQAWKDENENDEANEAIV